MGATVDLAGCAVGRLPGGETWVGFAPDLDDTYALVVGTPGASRRLAADADDLLSLAVAYFEEGLDEAPEELAATHGDIGSLVRHVAEAETEPARRALLSEAVDAIDDGLAGDVVVTRLVACLTDEEDAVARITRRAHEEPG